MISGGIRCKIMYKAQGAVSPSERIPYWARPGHHFRKVDLTKKLKFIPHTNYLSYSNNKFSDRSYNLNFQCWKNSRDFQSCTQKMREKMARFRLPEKRYRIEADSGNMIENSKPISMLWKKSKLRSFQLCWEKNSYKSVMVYHQYRLYGQKDLHFVLWAVSKE